MRRRWISGMKADHGPGSAFLTAREPLSAERLADRGHPEWETDRQSLDPVLDNTKAGGI